MINQKDIRPLKKFKTSTRTCQPICDGCIDIYVGLEQEESITYVCSRGKKDCSILISNIDRDKINRRLDGFKTVWYSLTPEELSEYA